MADEPITAAPAADPTPTPEIDPNTTPVAPEPVVEGAEPVAVAPAEGAIAEPTPIKKPWFTERIGELTKNWRETERKLTDSDRKAAALEAELAIYRSGAPPADGAVPVATPVAAAPASADFEKAVAAEATKRAAATIFQQKAQKWLDNGVKDFKDFNDRCAVVADLGAQDRPEFMQLVTDPEIIPDGHKVVAQLADQPEEAARILRLPATQMAAALTKFAMQNMNKPAPTKPISSAPAPITPIDGTARASDEITGEEDMGAFAAKWAKKDRERRGVGPRSL